MLEYAKRSPGAPVRGSAAARSRNSSTVHRRSGSAKISRSRPRRSTRRCPLVWLSSMRTVIRSASGKRAITRGGSTAVSGASRANFPSSTSCSVAAATNGFMMLPARKRSSGRIGRAGSRLAFPAAPDQVPCPGTRTESATPGKPVSGARTARSRIFCSRGPTAFDESLAGASATADGAVTANSAASADAARPAAAARRRRGRGMGESGVVTCVVIGPVSGRGPRPSSPARAVRRQTEGGTPRLDLRPAMEARVVRRACARARRPRRRARRAPPAGAPARRAARAAARAPSTGP